MAISMSKLLSIAFVGCLLGMTLSLIGFSDYSAVYHMFVLEEWRMILVFFVAVVIVGVYSTVRKVPVSRPFHPGIIPGGILFGVGWAISGACPSVPLVQLGEGKWWAICTVVGIVIGMVTYRYVHQKWFNWSSGSC